MDKSEYMSFEKVVRDLLAPDLAQQQQQKPGHFWFPHNDKKR